MKRLFLVATAALAIFSLTFAAACSDDDDDSSSSSGGTGAQAAGDSHKGWPDVFRLGLFGGDDAEETVVNAQPMKKLIEEALGMPVEIFTGTSYSAVIEAMRAGRIDGMTVGPFAYILGVQEAKAEALAVSISTTADPPVYDESLLPYYISVVFTKKGSGITKLDDIRGKGFNFVDPASASGHLAPKTALIKRGYNPDKDFQPVFAGSHPTSVLSVWEGKAPAGATNEGNLARLDKEGQIDWCEWPDGKINVPRSQEEIDAHFQSCPDGSVVVLIQTDPIPNTPFAVRQDLPAGLKQTLKDALLKTPQNAEFVSARKSWYVDPSSDLRLQHLDQFYNPLRDIAQLLNLDLRELAEGG
jgi:phosphonate transport system substrate-binding protein